MDTLIAPVLTGIAAIILSLAKLVRALRQRPEGLARRSAYVLPCVQRFEIDGRCSMQLDLRHDLRLRAAASVIYDTVYPGEEWAPVCFEEAERRETIHYRQAVEAALLVRPVLTDRAEQLTLI